MELITYNLHTKSLLHIRTVFSVLEAKRHLNRASVGKCMHHVSETKFAVAVFSPNSETALQYVIL